MILLINLQIDYMINPSLHINKLFREQFERCLSAAFHEKTINTIKDSLKDKNKCVMALIMFYENNGIKPKKCFGY